MAKNKGDLINRNKGKPADLGIIEEAAVNNKTVRDTLREPKKENRLTSGKIFKNIFADGTSFLKEKLNLSNSLKITLVAVGSLSNALLSNNYLGTTYALAIGTCFVPAAVDLYENRHYIKDKLKQLSKAGVLFGKIREEFPLVVLLEGTSIGIGVVSIATHILLNHYILDVPSKAVIALGTFVAGTAQMAVKPIVRKKIDKYLLENKQDLGLIEEGQGLVLNVDENELEEAIIADKSQMQNQFSHILKEALKSAENISLEIGQDARVVIDKTKAENLANQNRISELENEKSGLETKLKEEEEKTQKLEEVRVDLDSKVKQLEDEKKAQVLTMQDLEEALKKLTLEPDNDQGKGQSSKGR